MLERLRIKNFRCFVDFELDVSKINSCVLLGRNGTGKTTIATAMQILQAIAWRTSRVGELLKFSDFSDPSCSKMSFELDARIKERNYTYRIAFDLPERFRELRVEEETLSVNNEEVFSRQTSQISIKRSQVSGTQFGVDWHIVALPIIQTSSFKDPIEVFRNWLMSVIVIRPVPAFMKGDSSGETLIPNTLVDNFGEWFSGVLAETPSGYEPFISFLREVMPDVVSVKNRQSGVEFRSLEVEFKYEDKSFSLPFGRLSDGEKCFFVCALVLAVASVKSDVMCFWDEPDNYLAPQEISPTMLALRRSFQGDRQIIITSHNADAIRCFTDENTLVLVRNSHLTNPTVKTLSRMKEEMDGGSITIDHWIRGDIN